MQLVQQVHRVSPAQLAQSGQLAQPVHRDQLAQQVQPELQVLSGLSAPSVLRARAARWELQERPGPSDQLVQPVHRALKAQ